MTSAGRANTRDNAGVNSNVVMWFRRDLRVGDNPALRIAIDRAIAQGGSVAALFVHDAALAGPSGQNRLRFLYGALDSLRAAGVPLHELAGTPAEVVATFARQQSANTVVMAGDFAPYGQTRDDAVQTALAAIGVQCEVVDSPYVIEPGTITKADNTAYKVFTPFSKVWRTMALGVLPAKSVSPARVPWVAADAPPQGRAALAVNVGRGVNVPEATEAAAHARLKQFVRDDLRAYDTNRNDPAADSTSRLSAYLKFGLLHPRQVLAAVAEHPGSGTDVFVSEICWREFYADVLLREPASARHNLNPTMDDIELDNDARARERFAAWCAGRTGYPFVDAGMRQLLAEGWMHNRMRMVVASFLVKDLHLDWRWGARWFMEQLVDGDLASNQHGWQWTAGTGTDAAPYFRVFNPISQGRKFDPNGDYIRRHLPELAAYQNTEIHEPWLAKSKHGNGLFAGASDTSEYPGPIVDHAKEREETLRRYKARQARQAQ